MKRFRIYLILIILFPTAVGTMVLAGPPSFSTADVFNGHMWQLLSSSQKASHLTGIQEGIKLCLNQIREDLQISANLMREMKATGVFDRQRLLFSSQGITGIEAGLNNFYKDPLNVEIPIIDAYQHVTLELNFASATDLANNLSNLRRKYRDDMN